MYKGYLHPDVSGLVGDNNVGSHGISICSVCGGFQVNVTSVVLVGVFDGNGDCTRCCKQLINMQNLAVAFIINNVNIDWTLHIFYMYHPTSLPFGIVSLDRE